MAPKHGLPFADEVIGYCAKRLLALGLKPDREWLKPDQWTSLDALTLGDQSKLAAEARRNLPQSSAIWETSEFYRWAMPLAVFDAINGPMHCFENFELLYVRILGESARPWLPSLYLAAISSPNLIPEFRIECFNRFVPDRLDVEQEITDRQVRTRDQ